MDGMRLLVRLSVAAGVVVLVAVAILPAAQQGGAVTELVVATSGTDHTPMPLPTAEGYYLGAWNNVPVAIVVTTAQRLAAVDLDRGAGSATPSIAVPGHPELRMFALSAKSTHLGCTVGFNKGLGASKDIPDYDGDGVPDGRMLDPCHQGQWDVYHRGAPVRGTPAPARMAVLDLSVHDGRLVGTHFDGPIGPQKA